MTAVVHQPITVDQARREHAWSTPAWLRAMSVLLAAGAIAAGITGAVAVLDRQHATNHAIATAEPLVVDAVTLDVALSDANTTIAGGFLGAPPVPAGVQSHYASDLSTATTALTAAAQQAGGDRKAAGYLATLSTGLPLYSATLATAEENYREGFPVASAYLSEANYLLRSKLLTAAAALDEIEQARLDRDDSKATGSGLLALALGLLAVLLVLAVWTQVQVNRRFRRLINLGLVVMSVLVVVVGAWTVVATESASRSVTGAESKGTAPLATLIRARILAQQSWADEELALVTRNSDPSFETDYKSTAPTLATLFGAPHPGWTSAETRDLSGASGSWNAFRRLAPWTDGTAQQSSPSSTDQALAAQDAANVDTALGHGLNDAVAAFDSNARAASSDEGGLALAGVILMALAGVAAVSGLEPRVREYR